MRKTILSALLIIISVSLSNGQEAKNETDSEVLEITKKELPSFDNETATDFTKRYEAYLEKYIKVASENDTEALGKLAKIEGHPLFKEYLGLSKIVSENDKVKLKIYIEDRAKMMQKLME
jgi:hypothetical protein